jgi:hypothetical protein
LVESGTAIGALGVAAGSPFVTFLIALLAAAGGLILWLELLIREAAVYVVVMMLPLVFAAMVWPARRVWAIRAVEVLVALILAKFAIVSILALAAAALGHSGGSVIVRALAGLVLVMLGAFAPWVLLRLLPLAEVASAAAGHVRGHAQGQISGDLALGRQGVLAANDAVSSLVERVRLLGEQTTDRADDGHDYIIGAAGRTTSGSSSGEMASTPVPDGGGGPTTPDVGSPANDLKSASGPPTTPPPSQTASEPDMPGAPPPQGVNPPAPPEDDYPRLPQRPPEEDDR